MKIKRCPICDHELYCRDCGKRMTPEIPEKDKIREIVHIGLTTEQKKVMMEIAEKAGMKIGQLAKELVLSHLNQLRDIDQLKNFADLNKVSFKKYIQSMVGKS